MQDKILELLNNNASTFSIHGNPDWDKVIFEHDFEYIAEQINNLLNESKSKS